jgi:NADH:ubiquinone oxidoreductase subunit E
MSLLEPVLARNADDAGALIPVLQQAQEIYGCLPSDVMREIAEKRATPFSEVYGVATFYTQFHLTPRGKTIVRICHGTACHVAGAPAVTRAITDELDVAVGETSADLNFTVEGVACVGCCGLAPVVVVGEQVHGQVDASGARKLARRLRREAGR